MVWVIVQMPLYLHTMAARQGPQHGSRLPCDCGSAARIDQCPDLPTAWSMPYFWMRLSTRPVSLALCRSDKSANCIARTDFLAGQFFDIRLEVHAPVNGSEANGGNPDPDFSFSITKDGKTERASTYFGVSEPALERWNFTWYEGL